MIVGPALELLRGQLSALAEAWHTDAADDESNFTVNQARAVLGTVVYAFELEASQNRAVCESLFGFEPDLRLQVAQVSQLRSLLHRAITRGLAPDEALPAVERLHELLDVLLDCSMRRALDHLEEVALADPLTGAGNRRALERDAARELAVARRHDLEVAVVAIDLDGLKQINDEYGHATGDDVLRQLVAAFGKHLRESDGVYRVGGDEFIVLLPGTGRDGVRTFVERASAEAPAFSFGAASAPADGWLVEPLLVAADQRLLDAKRGDRPPPGGPGGSAGSRLPRGLFNAMVPVAATIALAELGRRVAGIPLSDGGAAVWIASSAAGLLAGTALLRHVAEPTGSPSVAQVGVVSLPLLAGLGALLVPLHRPSDADPPGGLAPSTTVPPPTSSTTPAPVSEPSGVVEPAPAIDAPAAEGPPPFVPAVD